MKFMRQIEVGFREWGGGGDGAMCGGTGSKVAGGKEKRINATIQGEVYRPMF